ncbi:MAG: hypothetical protein GXP45_05550 [bacterium]|nr:hypothetical protein [bacterium]
MKKRLKKLEAQSKPAKTKTKKLFKEKIPRHKEIKIPKVHLSTLRKLNYNEFLKNFSGYFLNYQSVKDTLIAMGKIKGEKKDKILIYEYLAIARYLGLKQDPKRREKMNFLWEKNRKKIYKRKSKSYKTVSTGNKKKPSKKKSSKAPAYQWPKVKPKSKRKGKRDISLADLELNFNKLDTIRVLYLEEVLDFVTMKSILKKFDKRVSSYEVEKYLFIFSRIGITTQEPLFSQRLSELEKEQKKLIQQRRQTSFLERLSDEFIQIQQDFSQDFIEAKDKKLEYYEKKISRLRESLLKVYFLKTEYLNGSFDYFIKVDYAPYQEKIQRILFLLDNILSVFEDIQGVHNSQKNYYKLSQTLQQLAEVA